MTATTGYGPRTSRPFFDGNDDRYELWETRFVGHLRHQKLHSTILSPDEGGVATADLNAEKNAEAFAELSLCIDDRSLSLVLRDAKNDGRKALKILRTHYQSSSETRVIGLYTELTSLKKAEGENVTDYLLRGETAAAQLKQAGETVSDNLIIAMILKGLPQEYKSFVTVTTQMKEKHDLASFKSALRNEETAKACGESTENVMAVNNKKKEFAFRCFGCGEIGHRKSECPVKKSDAGEKRRRWCDNCKSPTHDTKYCRKLKKSSVKSVSATEGHSFAFKVTVKPEDCEFVHGLNSLLVDTGATTHIVNDKSKFTSFDKNFEPDKHYIELADGSRRSKLAEGRGQAEISLKDSQGVVRNAVLEDALYVPSFKQNIFFCATSNV